MEIILGDILAVAREDLYPFVAVLRDVHLTLFVHSYTPDIVEAAADTLVPGRLGVSSVRLLLQDSTHICHEDSVIRGETKPKSYH